MEIQATINNKSNVPTNFGAAAKKLETFTDGPVGSFLLEIINTANGSELTEAGKYAELGIDGFTVFKGTVDDKPKKTGHNDAVLQKTAEIIGRNNARELAQRFITFNYRNYRLGDLINDALSRANSSIKLNPSQIGTGPIVSVFAKNMFLTELFKEACLQGESDYTYNWNTNNISFWPLTNPPDTGVLLKMLPNDSNILVIESDNEIGNSIVNVIQVSGGDVQNHWIQYMAGQWTGVNATLDNDETSRIYGAASIRVDFHGRTPSNNPTNTDPQAHLRFPNFYYQWLPYENVDVATCSVYLRHSIRGVLFHDAVSKAFNLYIKDDQNNVLRWQFGVGFKAGSWVKKTFTMGCQAPITNTVIADSAESDAWRFVSGSDFNWRIVDLWIVCERGTVMDNENAPASFWIDGLELGGVDAIAVAYDSGSMGKVGTSMLPLFRPNLPKNMQALETAAAKEMMSRKDEFAHVNLIATFQKELLFTGMLLTVLAPDANIGSGTSAAGGVKYRIQSIRHECSPGTPIYRKKDAITRLELIRFDNGKNINNIRLESASNNQLATNSSVGLRLYNLEEFSKGNGGGSAAGSIGGGGAVDWDNVPYINLKGHLHMVEANSTTDPKQKIEIRNLPYHIFPNRWGTNQVGDMVMFLRSFEAVQNGRHDYSYPNSSHIAFVSQNNYVNDTGQNQLGTTTFLSQVDFQSGGTGIACSHHLLVRKDFVLNGMINCLEGAIVLHGGMYRQWLGAPQQPTIYSGGMQPLFNTVSFKNFMTDAYIPIRPGGIIDRNGSEGTARQVLTKDPAGGLVWGTADNASSNMKSGTGTTPHITQGNETAGYRRINFKTPFPVGSVVRVTATVKNAQNAITISVQNITREYFEVTTKFVTTANHRHVVGSAAKSEDVNPLVNHIHSTRSGVRTNQTDPDGTGHRHNYSDGYAGGVDGKTGSAENLTMHLRQLWMRQQKLDGALDSVSVGGCLVAQAVNQITLYTEDFVPGPTDGFVAVGCAFDWFATLDTEGGTQ